MRESRAAKCGYYGKMCGRSIRRAGFPYVAAFLLTRYGQKEG